MMRGTQIRRAVLAGSAVMVLFAGMALGYGRQNQDKTLPRINLDDIGTKYVVIGRLGKPLGEFSTVRGVWFKKPSAKWERTFFKITHIDGERLDTPLVYDDWLVSSIIEQPKPTDGATWEMRVHEHGGFMGDPDGTWKESGLAPGAGEFPFRFMSKIHSMRHKVITSEAVK